MATIVKHWIKGNRSGASQRSALYQISNLAAFLHQLCGPKRVFLDAEYLEYQTSKKISPPSRRSATYIPPHLEFSSPKLKVTRKTTLMCTVGLSLMLYYVLGVTVLLA